jgi:hypothetical protein
MSWTHPICETCWKERNPNREPVTVKDDEVEKCCYCGKATSAGIYIRENPLNVKFTREER